MSTLGGEDLDEEHTEPHLQGVLRAVGLVLAAAHAKRHPQQIVAAVHKVLTHVRAKASTLRTDAAHQVTGVGLGTPERGSLHSTVNEGKTLGRVTFGGAGQSGRSPGDRQGSRNSVVKNST